MSDDAVYLYIHMKRSSGQNEKNAMLDYLLLRVYSAFITRLG